MNKYRIILIIFFLTFLNCMNEFKINKVNLKKLAKVSINNKNYDFGAVKIGDTIKHTFYLTNLSNQVLRVKKVATSCGCSIVNKIDSTANINQKIKIDLQFVPKKEQIGFVTNSLVVELNSNPPFQVFKLKGIVENN